MADRQARKNAFLYCKFRDEQFASYDAYVKRHGLLMNTLLTVNALYYAKDGLTQREICRRTLLSKQTVNLIIKHLLAEESATADSNEADHRSQIIRMTDQGRARYGEAVRHITRSEDDAMATLTPQEQQTLVELSRKFTNKLIELINADMEEQDHGIL